MDFVNKAYSQVAELFRSMTPAGRITTGLLIASIVISLGFLFRSQTDRASDYLFGAETLTNSEIAALEAAFGKAGLNDYESTGNRIRVPRSKRHLYMTAAADNDAIPPRAEDVWQKMLDGPLWVDSRHVQEMKERVTREKHLAQTLMEMPDIEKANVAIEESTDGGFPPRKVKRAMVAAKAIGQRKLDNGLVQAIRHTVGVAVDGVENVTVIDLNGGVFAGDGNGTGLPEENKYATYQRQYSEMYKRLISDALTVMIPGVQVIVNAELEKEELNQSTSVKIDDKPVALSSSNYTKEQTSSRGTGGGRPGAVPNGAVGNAPAQVAANDSANESTTNETSEDQRNAVGTTHMTIRKAPFAPVTVSASIAIPTSHFLRVWQANNSVGKGEPAKTPTTDELAQLEIKIKKEVQDIVANLLPKPTNGDDRSSPVTVITYTEPPVAEYQEPSMAKTAASWFAENWQTLGLFGLAAFGVVFLRGMIRSSQKVPVSESVALREAHAGPIESADKPAAHDEHAGGEETVASTLKRRFQSSGRSLRDELTDLVKEDPDAAANILKLWISDAA